MTSRTSGKSRKGFLRGRLGAGAPTPPPPSAPGDVLAEARDVTVRLGAREVLHGVCVAARAA